MTTNRLLTTAICQSSMYHPCNKDVPRFLILPNSCPLKMEKQTRMVNQFVVNDCRCHMMIHVIHTEDVTAAHEWRKAVGAMEVTL